MPRLSKPGDVIRLEGVDVPKGARFVYVDMPRHYSNTDGSKSHKTKGQNSSIQIRCMLAPSTRQDARGSIILQPGRTEFIEKFFETVEDFRRRGFTVLVLDPRGQGLSSRLLDDGLKSYVDDFEDYCDDLAGVVDHFKADLPRPHILVGHSMGGTIGLQAILTGRLNPAASIFTAPMLELHDLDGSFMSFIIRAVARLGMGERNLPLQAQRNGQPVSFRANKLTSDPNRYQLWATYFENHQRLRVGPPTFGWISSALKAMRFVNDNAKHLNLPTLITACGADPIVTPSSNIRFAKASGSDLVNIPGALHEIFLENDEYRKPFWAKVDEFLEANAL